MSQEFFVEDGSFGPRLVPTAPWNAKMTAYMVREQIRELSLNHDRGWRGDDLEFLSTLPPLQAFSIIDFTISDISPIHVLRDVRWLEISTYCRTPIDFSVFHILQHCSFYWRPGSDSLFRAETLQSLFIHRYSERESRAIGGLQGLRTLTIANSAVEELRSLAPLSRLRSLELHNLKKVKSLDGLEALTGLEALEVSGCRNVADISPVQSLLNLRKLYLNEDGHIASLAPVKTLVKVEELLFYGSTYIDDGDLSVLERLPELRKVSFQNRRHYSHNRESFRHSSEGR